jgi:hypothetical protein
VLSSPYTSGAGGGAMIVGRHKLVVNVLNSGWDQPPGPSNLGAGGERAVFSPHLRGLF